jgi:hypothetical protein
VCVCVLLCEHIFDLFNRFKVINPTAGMSNESEIAQTPQ